MLYEGNELMIPVLTATGELPTINANENLNEKVNIVLNQINSYDDDTCQKEKDIIS